MKGTMAILLAWSFLSLLPASHGANILFFFGFSTYSHRIAIWPLVLGLADRGHNITFYQPIEPKRPDSRVHELFPSAFKVQIPGRKRILDFDFLANRLESSGPIGNQLVSLRLPDFGLQYCEDLLGSPETGPWLNSSSFDLLILDALCGNECGYGLAAKFRAKVILYSSGGVEPAWPDSFGFPVESSWLAHQYFPFPSPMGLLDRTLNTWIPVLVHLHRTWFYYPALEALLRKELREPDMPPIAQLERSSSLALVNTHFSVGEPSSSPPFMIPVGGMHIGSAKGAAFTQELKTFIAEAGTEGFIYVSFGTSITYENMPKAIFEVFTAAFGKSPFRFVWKWSGERPSGMPPNVFTSNWLPQEGILAAPELKAMITHGGHLSIQETAYHGVPVIVFPLFANHDYFADKMESSGRGLKLEISQTTVPILEEAIREIVLNPKYKENAVKTKVLFKDRARSPLDEALWWVHWVLRTNDSSAMKPLFAAEQYWFQRRLLDVWALTAIFILSPLWITVYLIRKLKFGVTRTKQEHQIGDKQKTA